MGKSVLPDMIATGAEADVVVVGLIGERAREVSDFVERHMAGSKRAHTAVVAVPADHAPNLRLRGAMLATSLAEQFRAEGLLLRAEPAAAPRARRRQRRPAPERAARRVPRTPRR